MNIIKNRCILFLGPDGVGKTTQASLLRKHFAERGLKTSQVCIRSQHTLAFILSRILMKLGYYKIVPNPHGIGGPGFHLRVKGTSQFFWYLIEFFSVTVLILGKFFIPYNLNRIIIAERYVIDTIITMAYILEDPKIIKSGISRTLLRFIPEKSSIINLDANYESILNRREWAHNRKFIEFQKKYSRVFARFYKAHKINTSEKNIKETHNSILKIIYQK